MTVIPAWALAGKPREWARMLGITKIAGAIGGMRGRARRRSFLRSRPTIVELALADGVIRATTGTAEEYLRAMSLKDDRHLIDALAVRVRPGDVFWDVGANIGLYALALSKRIGAAGHIQAFEPEPRALRSLVKNIAVNQAAKGPGADRSTSTMTAADGDDAFANIDVIAVALSDVSGTHELHVAKSGADGTHSLVSGTSPRGDDTDVLKDPHGDLPADVGDTRSVTVRTARGDLMIERGAARAPNVIKLDVEGAELQALDGLGAALREPQLRAVLVEVHAAVLWNAGIKDAPRRIARQLEDNGLTRQTWLDASHLLAERPQPI